MTSFSFYFPHRAKSTGTYALLPCSFCIVFRMPTKLFDEFSNEIQNKNESQDFLNESK
jgi:hypothetical protein